MISKQCSKCNEIYDISMFHTKKRNTDGHMTNCKICHRNEMQRYFRTKKGLIAKIYGAQKRTSLKRGHSAPTYTKTDLTDWLFSQKKFHVLFDNWARLDYQKNYVPSVDRISHYIGYTMDNIQLMTWRENDIKGWKEKAKRGKRTHK